MKTIKEWFNGLPNDVREKALINTSKNNLNLEVENLTVALSTAFLWYKSPEGHDYWESIISEL